MRPSPPARAPSRPPRRRSSPTPCVAARWVERAGRGAAMAGSIRGGIAALPPEGEAVVIALAAQPLVSSGVVRRLCDRWRAGGVSAVAPRYRDGRGHPVLFGRETFAALGT